MTMIKPDREKFKTYKIAGLQSAAKFRVNFAKTELDNLKESKVAGKQWRRIDETKGTNLPFSKMVQDQGDDTDALVGCVKVAQQCLAMGPPWDHRPTHKLSRHTSRTRVRGDTMGGPETDRRRHQATMVGVVQRGKNANSVTTAPADPMPPHWADATPHW